MKTKLSYNEIAYKNNPSNVTEIVVLYSSECTKVLEYVDIPVEVRLDMCSDITVEEKCIMLRKYLESININEIKWNDNYNFNELLYIRKWVEVECD